MHCNLFNLAMQTSRVRMFSKRKSLLQDMQLMSCDQNMTHLQASVVDGGGLVPMASSQEATRKHLSYDNKAVGATIRAAKDAIQDRTCLQRRHVVCIAWVALQVFHALHAQTCCPVSCEANLAT